MTLDPNRPELRPYQMNRVRDSDSKVRATQPKPAKGPGFICQYCGRPVEALHSDEQKRAYELKWKLHWKCRRFIEKYCDILSVPPAMRSYHELLDALQDDDEETADGDSVHSE